MVGEQVYTASSLGELPAVAKAILEALEDEWLVYFWGGMGVGKTTLIAEICRQLGVVGEVASPTFALINVYNCRGGREIYHFDFYRIEAVQDAWNIGAEEYLGQNLGLCLVEWPGVVESLLPERRIDVHCREMDGGTREFRIVRS